MPNALENDMVTWRSESAVHKIPSGRGLIRPLFCLRGDTASLDLSSVGISASESFESEERNSRSSLSVGDGMLVEVFDVGSCRTVVSWLSSSICEKTVDCNSTVIRPTVAAGEDTAGCITSVITTQDYGLCLRTRVVDVNEYTMMCRE